MRVPQNQKVKSQLWFITGVSSGFGLSIARRALESGARVAGTTRRPDSDGLREVAEAHPDRLSLFVDALRDDRARGEACERVLQIGTPDVVLLNAGFGVFAPVEEMEMRDVMEMMEVNFIAQMDVIRRCLPAMRANGGGVVLVMGAAAAIANYPGFAAYGASKAALECAAEALAQEVKPHGIRVHIVQPGPFRTGFLRAGLSRSSGAGPAHEATVGKFMKLLASMEGRQSGDPERAAAAVMDLVSREDCPLRVPLGKYAGDKSRRTAAARMRDLERTVFAEGTDFSS